PEPGARADVAAVIDDMMPSLVEEAAERQEELLVEPLPPCAIACAPGLLTSAIANLVRNAIKYISDSPVRRITVRVVARGEVVRFEVEDTGPGLPPELERTVFEPHVRGPNSQQPGIGL